MAAGVVSYMLLCAGLVSLTSYPSPYSSSLIGGGFFSGPPPGFCYVCVCVCA